MASKVTEKNRAIVLQSLRYGDNSMIVKILTENSGLQSYIVKGILNKKSKIRPALFQNMTLVDIVYKFLEYPYQELLKNWVWKHFTNSFGDLCSFGNVYGDIDNLIADLDVERKLIELTVETDE